MRVMGIDDATNVGWALYDTDKPISAIISQRFHLDGDKPFDKILQLRDILPPLLKLHRPHLVAVEAPKMKVTKFTKAPKRDMLTGVVTQPAKGSEYSGDDHTTCMLNQIYGAVVMAVAGMNIDCISVAPKTWQTIIPKSIRGDPKQRVAQLLNTLNIVSPNMDSRDACLIALWAAGHGHSQRYKLAEESRGQRSA